MNEGRRPVDRTDGAGPSEGPVDEAVDSGSGAAPTGENAPTGGDALTDEQLTADNAVEEDTLKGLDPDNPP